MFKDYFSSSFLYHRYTQKQNFDICIIDEATQCLESNSLVPTLFGIRKLILVGDTQQLPAMTLSKVSIFGIWICSDILSIN